MAEIIHSIAVDIFEVLPTILFIAVVGFFSWILVEAEDEINKNKGEMEIMNRYPIITICCSTRYISEIIEYYNELTQKGYIVLADLTPHDKRHEFDKELVDKVNLSKIDMADEVHFLLKDKHVDESVKNEFEYAKAKEKYITIVSI